jgi:membrane associated rhomboid family serine protease
MFTRSLLERISAINIEPRISYARTALSKHFVVRWSPLSFKSTIPPISSFVNKPYLFSAKPSIWITKLSTTATQWQQNVVNAVTRNGKLTRDSLRFAPQKRSGYLKELNKWTDPFFHDSKKVLWTLIGINVAVFASWTFAVQSYRGGKPSYLTWMVSNFTSSVDGVLNQGRWWAMITCNFSHKDFWHLALNMFVLHSFGGNVMSINPS